MKYTSDSVRCSPLRHVNRIVPRPSISTDVSSPSLTKPRTLVSSSEKNLRRPHMWLLVPESRNQAVSQ